MNYQKISEIEPGGFGTVWRARRIEDGREFAQKCLDQTDGDSIDRFRKEVRILSELDHPNIVKVVGKRLIDPPYFYIMPLYACSLADQIPDINGDEERIRLIFNQILDGVEYAHRQGVIHRDLKPKNILYNSDSDVVVSDFGLGRVVNSDSVRKTKSNTGMGSFMYVAPEQINNAKEVSERADIYALGRILLELYEGDITAAIMSLDHLPGPIATIITRCVNRSPKDRFQSVSELKMVFRSVFDTAVLSARMEAFDAIVSKLTTGLIPTSLDIEILTNGLIGNLKDGDFIMKTVMAMPSGVMNRIEAYNKDSSRRIISKFSEFVTSQGWPFEFTDKIGDCCASIYPVIGDTESRACLTYAAAEVGSSHNRWRVIDAATNMIAARKQPGEAISLVPKLRKLGERYTDVYKAKLNLAAIDPLLAAFFQEVSDSSAEISSDF